VNSIVSSQHPHRSMGLLNKTLQRMLRSFHGNSELSRLEHMPITPDSFHKFTYSKSNHFRALRMHGSISGIDTGNCDLKVYQDMLTYNFVLDNFPEGSKLLEIGGGDSRIIRWLKDRYEFWNLDKLEGVGNGLTGLSSTDGFKLVQDYIGAFSNELPDNYFDGVFSVSVLEHVPEDEATINSICDDIHRLLKPGGLSMHCIDRVLLGGAFRKYLLLDHIYSKVPVINPRISAQQIASDPDLWGMSKKAYDRLWRPAINMDFKQFGIPISYNLIWRND